MAQDYKRMYYTLLKEHQQLQIELKETKKILETYAGEEVKIAPPPNPTKAKSNDELVALFRSLFRGREDVFALRFHNTRSGRAGYAPQCHNEWQKGICDKKKYKCVSCPHQKFKQLSSTVIEAHLHGNDPLHTDVVGIYPILPDETCYFLAVDFDKDNWQQDVTAFKKTCEVRSVPVYIERSRSGEGCHAWFFFSEKIPIKLARKLGNLMLTETMNNHHQLKFKSYDRLFPNQDYMPKGGLGNLIALPLQGAAVRQGNSVFIDEHFNPIKDQWSFLETIKKISLGEIQKICDDLQATGDLGKLMNPANDTKPWEQQKLTLTLNREDFPEQVKVVSANRIYVDKRGMSSRSLNEIKRLATFSNPKFYELQRQRLSTHSEDSIITCAFEEGNYLSIPRGCLEDLKSLLDGASINYEIDDKRFAGNPLEIEFNGELRTEQELAVNDLLARDIGVLSATTAFGKTVVAANLIVKRKVNTLILVHTSALMNQWKGALENFLIFHEALPEPPKGQGRKKEISHIGQLGSGKNTLRGRIDVAIMQSLVNGKEVRDLVANYGMVIVDECHRVSAYGYEQILSKVHAKYVYGLSATPERQDGRHPIVFMQCGKIRHYVSAKEQAKKRAFDHLFIPRFTTLKKPAHISEEEFSLATAQATLVENEERNLRIVQDIVKSIEDGRNPIILTNRTAHIERLEELLKKHTSCKMTTLTGQDTNKQKREALEKLHAIPENTQCIIIATGKYVGEGFDFPRLDTLFLVMPFSWSGILHQYAGRLHREYEGKKEVIIYDYVDIHIKIFENMYHKRVKGYAMLGYRAKTDYEQQSEARVLFDQHDFLPILKKDMSEARLRITISSPRLKKSRTIGMMNYLRGLTLSSKNITIITKPISEYKISEVEMIKELLDQLKLSGFTIIQRPGIHQKFIVIDEQVVWYGSINLFAHSRAPETMLRFINQDIAGEIMENVDKSDT